MASTYKAVELDLRRLLLRYNGLKIMDNLGAAISTREDIGRFVVAHGEEILHMLQRYNAPLSEPEENEADGAPF